MPFLVAAALALIVGIGAAVTQPWASEDDVPRLTAAEQILQAPDAQEVFVDLGEAGRATVTRSKSADKAVITTEDMVAAPDGKAYELWFVGEDGGFTSAGLMPDSPDQTVVLTGTTLAWNVTHTLTNATMGHIHLGHAGETGGVEVPICTTAGNCTGTITGSATLTADQLTALQSGNLYVNIHSYTNSTTNSNGEIRGQILKTGEKLYSAQLTDGTANGSAGFIVDQANTCLHYNVTLIDATGVTGANITDGTNTLVALPNVMDMGGEGTVTVTSSDVTTLDADAGVLVATGFGRGTAATFIAALAKHRHPERETDPPRV